MSAGHRPDPAAIEWTTVHRPHPMHAYEFTGLFLELLMMAWTREVAEQILRERAEQPIPFEVVLDHGVCGGDDCIRRLCACPGTQCQGHGDNACTHGRWLCDGCRSDCAECRVDALDDRDGA